LADVLVTMSDSSVRVYSYEVVSVWVYFISIPGSIAEMKRAVNFARSAMYGPLWRGDESRLTNMSPS